MKFKNNVVKSLVLAGVVSVGVFAGGQISEAAAPVDAKQVKTVKVEKASDSKIEVKTNKAQASVNASATAKETIFLASFKWA